MAEGVAGPGKGGKSGAAYQPCPGASDTREPPSLAREGTRRGGPGCTILPILQGLSPWQRLPEERGGTPSPPL